MKNVKKLVAACLITVMAFSLSGCTLIEKTPEAVAKSKVAKYSNGTIIRSEVDAKMAPLMEKIKSMKGEGYEKTEEGKNFLKEQRKQILESMISEKIILDKAVELKVMPKEEELKAEVDKQFKELKDSFGSEDAYKKALEQSGSTEEQIKENIKNQIIFKKVYDKVVQDVKVTDEDAKKEYDSNMTKYTEKPNKTYLKHILVSTEDEANKIIKRLESGEDFDKIGNEIKESAEKQAKEKEKEEVQQQARFEDLGWVDYNNPNFDKTFMQFAVPLQKNGYTKAPVHTQFGYHIIKCFDKEEYPVKKFEEVKEEIKKDLLNSKKQQTWKETLEKWDKESNKKIYENNLE